MRYDRPQWCLGRSIVTHARCIPRTRDDGSIAQAQASRDSLAAEQTGCEACDTLINARSPAPAHHRIGSMRPPTVRRPPSTVHRAPSTANDCRGGERKTLNRKLSTFIFFSLRFGRTCSLRNFQTVVNRSPVPSPAPWGNGQGTQDFTHENESHENHK